MQDRKNSTHTRMIQVERYLVLDPEINQCSFGLGRRKQILAIDRFSSLIRIWNQTFALV